MIRRADWESSLASYLDGQRGAVHTWGKNDCALFAAGAVQAMTGSDPAEGLRGRYRTPRGSVRILRRHGWRDLRSMMDARFEAIHPAYARRGDIVMAGESLGICIGRNAVFVGEEGGDPGLVPLPMADWAHAWRIAFQG